MKKELRRMYRIKALRRAGLNYQQRGLVIAGINERIIQDLKAEKARSNYNEESPSDPFKAKQLVYVSRWKRFTQACLAMIRRVLKLIKGRRGG